MTNFHENALKYEIFKASLIVWMAVSLSKYNMYPRLKLKR